MTADEIESLQHVIDEWRREADSGPAHAARDATKRQCADRLESELAALVRPGGVPQHETLVFEDTAVSIASERENFGFDNYVALIEGALRDAYESGLRGRHGN